MRTINHLLTLAAVLVAICACNPAKTPQDGEYSLDIYATNDVHGRLFDSLYVGDGTRESLLAVSEYMNRTRAEKGEDNVMLLDVGDLLQGDNSVYYYNYVDTESRHLACRMVEYMKYDALVVGNHDIETGHEVYDRFKKELKIPYLAANAIRDDNGKPYFQPYTIVERGGLRVAVLGYTNPNIKAWLAREIWDGMHFVDLMECVQADVDRVRAKEKPHLVIVAVHSGTGNGEGSELESQGLDLLSSLEGVDFIFCSHDHRPYTENRGDCVLLNSGSHCRKLAHATAKIEIRDGEVVSKEVSGEICDIDKEEIDTVMRDMFRPDYEAVKAFTVQKVGELAMPLKTRDAFVGMCDYMNLIHRICLDCTDADLSFAAPLSFNSTVNAGDVLYNDLFTIYPYENQIFVLNMKGREIEKYLEYSYDQWINTLGDGHALKTQGHALKIQDREDPRSGAKRWSFVNRSYNFDSLGGAFYTVDLSKPYGDRVEISRLADGRDFDPEDDYKVAMTSYRANGGGELMQLGAGIDASELEGRVSERYPEVRELLFDFFRHHLGADGEIAPVTSEELSDPALIGAWSFIPEDLAIPALREDYRLLFE